MYLKTIDLIIITLHALSIVSLLVSLVMDWTHSTFTNKSGYLGRISLAFSHVTLIACTVASTSFYYYNQALYLQIRSNIIPIVLFNYSFTLVSITFLSFFLDLFVGITPLHPITSDWKQYYPLIRGIFLVVQITSAIQLVVTISFIAIRDDLLAFVYFWSNAVTSWFVIVIILTGIVLFQRFIYGIIQYYKQVLVHADLEAILSDQVFSILVRLTFAEFALMVCGSIVICIRILECTFNILPPSNISLMNDSILLSPAVDYSKYAHVVIACCGIVVASMFAGGYFTKARSKTPKFRSEDLKSLPVT